MLPPIPPDRLIEWTGERCVPWADDRRVVYEHLHRYVLAAGLAVGKKVLDLGSGEGYGAAMLAEVAESVTGIEIDGDSVEHARRRYRAENLKFLCRSVLDLDDLDDDAFDLIVCFEMIEHIGEQDDLVASARRLLKRGELFLVSTPDREIYSEASDYHNPFHVKEMNQPEFAELLGRHFKHVAMWTQSVVMGSILRSVGTPTGRLDGGGGVGLVDGMWQQQPLAPPPYLLAIASSAPLPALPSVSVLHDGGALAELSGSDLLPSSGEASLYELWDEERLRRQVAIYETAITEEIDARRQAQLDAAESDRVRLDLTAALEASGAQVRRLQSTLDEIERSRAWQVVLRYRRLRELPRSRQQGGASGV